MSDPDKLQVFEGGGIRVTWSKVRCIHSAECVRGLPRVFQPGSRPWVKPDAGAANRIAEIIERCPTGALHYERKDGGATEAPPERNTVTPEPDGPLLVRGRIEILDSAGEVRLSDTRVALCRCGASANRPFCDGSHRRARFTDAGDVFQGGVKAEGEAAAVLRLTVTPRGPFEARGALVVRSADGLMRLPGGRAAFCRCGGSRNKPFCDGTHLTNGFEAESTPD